MGKKLKLKVKRGKMKLKLKSGDEALPLTAADIRGWLADAAVQGESRVAREREPYSAAIPAVSNVADD